MKSTEFTVEYDEFEQRESFDTQAEAVKRLNQLMGDHTDIHLHKYVTEVGDEDNFTEQCLAHKDDNGYLDTTVRVVA